MEPGEDIDDVIDNAERKGLQTPGFMTMIGSFEGFLMIFKDTKLAWTAKMQTPSIFIGKSNFQGINGMIVSMSDSGFLQIGYLGTDQLT